MSGTRHGYQSLRAAEWAKDNLEGVKKVLGSETRGTESGVTDTYRNGFHQNLHPELSAERLELLGLQKKFLLLHGFLDGDFSLSDWVDARPQKAEHRLLEERSKLAA